MTVLTPYRSCRLIEQPFPHLVIENALDPALAQRLTVEFPALDFFTAGRGYPDCYKRHYAGTKALDDPAISDTWKAFIADNGAPAMREDLLTLFSAALERRWPDLAGEFGRPQDWRLGLRYRDGFDHCDALLDCQFSLHTPVFGPRAAADRGPHVKMTDKLFVGHLFLRQPDDPAEGGGLEVFSRRPGAKLHFGRDNVTDRRQLRLEETIPFANNTLVFWLNSPEAIQGFVPRTPGQLPMTYVNFFVELPRPLFALPRTPAARLRNLLGTLRYRSAPPRQQAPRFQSR